VLFGDKENYMKPMNTYVRNNIDRLQAYFDKLVTVEDLSDALQLDKYLEHTSVRMNSINISINQIFLIHSLLEKNLASVVCPSSSLLVVVVAAVFFLLALLTVSYT
jgi:Ras GTPase-activating-like protein IQGAP2/3